MPSEGRVRELALNAASRGGAAIQGPQRERGLWSFLTWSFFLSQLAAGNAFAAGAAQADNTTNLNTPDGSADAGKAGAAFLGTTETRPLGDLEAQSAAPLTAAAPLQSDSMLAHAKPSGIEQSDMTSDASVALESAATQGSAGSETAMQVSASDNDGVVVVDTLSVGLPDSELPQIVDLLPVLDGLLPPMLETIGDLVDGLGETLDGLLTPVVQTVEDLAGVLGPTLDQTLAPVEALTEGLTNALEATLDPLLTPVANLTEDVGNLIEPIGGIAGEIIQLADPVMEIVEPVLAPVISIVETAQPILDPVLDVAAPIVDLLDPVLEPLLQPLAPVAAPVLDILPMSIGNDGFLGDLFGISGPGDDAVVSTGTLAFTADTEESAYDLIEKGAYTEFGITLNQSPIGNESSAGDLVENIVEIASSLIDNTDDADNALPTLLGSLQHDLGFRGLGEGLI